MIELKSGVLCKKSADSLLWVKRLLKMPHFPHFKLSCDSSLKIRGLLVFNNIFQVFSFSKVMCSFSRAYSPAKRHSKQTAVITRTYPRFVPMTFLINCLQMACYGLVSMWRKFIISIWWPVSVYARGGVVLIHLEAHWWKLRQSTWKSKFWRWKI